MAEILDLVESRKHSFSETLHDANNLLSEHFFAQKPKNALLPDESVFEPIDFDDFLRSASTSELFTVPGRAI